MGYDISMMESNFFIPADKRADALNAIKAMAGNYRWVGEDHKHAETLEEAFEIWGYGIEQDDENNVTDIYFDREKLGDEDEMFGAIAPFVKAGSYIEMLGTGDGSRWRWFFDGEKMVEQTGKVAWE